MGINPWPFLLNGRDKNLLFEFLADINFEI
jgi:hypothetical protein